MTRQQALASTVTLLIIAAMTAIVFQPSQSILGQFSGDAFCQGFPTRYWSQQLHAGPGPRSEAMTRLETAKGESLSVLQELLSHDMDPEVRWTAAELLGKLGPEAHTASGTLIKATQDADSHVRALAVVAIPKVETPVEQALPVLIPMLKSEHAGVVARAISVYKDQGRDALPELVAILRDENRDTETRWNAARALGKLGPAGIDSLPVLIEFCAHPEETIREHSAEAIGDIGPAAVAGIPALIDCLDDPAIRVRRDAVRSLGYIGQGARPAVEQIKPLLQDPEAIVRDTALATLKIIAPEEVPAVPAIEPISPAGAPLNPPADTPAATEPKPQT